MSSQRIQDAHPRPLSPLSRSPRTNRSTGSAFSSFPCTGSITSESPRGRCRLSKQGHYMGDTLCLAFHVDVVDFCCDRRSVYNEKGATLPALLLAEPKNGLGHLDKELAPAVGFVIVRSPHDACENFTSTSGPRLKKPTQGHSSSHGPPSARI